jgi:hypothetical protein
MGKNRKEGYAKSAKWNCQTKMYSYLSYFFVDSLCFDLVNFVVSALAYCTGCRSTFTIRYLVSPRQGKVMNFST